jgi:phosphate:Na+ symporter
MVQASSATIGVVAALHAQHVISFEVAASLVLGASTLSSSSCPCLLVLSVSVRLFADMCADIGTTGTALISSLGRSRASLRVAVTYMLQKIVTSAVILPFLKVFVHIVAQLSPGAGPMRLVANSHTFFNCAVAIVCFRPQRYAALSLLTRLHQ